MNKKVLYAGLAICFAVNTLHAERYTGRTSQNKDQKYQIGRDIPDVENSNRYLYPAIHRDRIEMQTPKQSRLYKDVQAQEYYRKKVLDGTFDLDISMKPEYRILRDVDEIKITPNYILAIFLPDEMVITDAKVSFECGVKEFKNNMIRIQPKDNFYSGNIAITYTDGKKNLYMTIKTKRYFQSRAEIEDYISAMKKSSPSIANALEKKYSSVNNYAYAKSRTSLIYKYILPTIISDDEAIKLYERMTHKKGINIEDGDYVSFIYDGVTYRIIRDDTQGTLIYGKKAYRVENSMQDSI